MIKTIAVLTFTAFSVLQVAAQDIFMTRSGEITFFSSTPVEDIEAENKSVTCILKTQTGELAFMLFMKSFSFERAAMQQHFNDDYVHSDEYPKATFEGSISNADGMDFSKDGKYEVDVIGNLTIHGITREVSESGTIEIKDGKIHLDAVFDIQLSDYDVKVPSNMLKNISNDIEITVDAALAPYER
jgi:hypothetical protein